MQDMSKINPTQSEDMRFLAGKQKEPTAVKFLNELDVEIADDEIPEDERLISISVYECCTCHWKFFGDCERTGYGFTLEGTQTPNYCPMCGRKINDCIEK